MPGVPAQRLRPAASSPVAARALSRRAPPPLHSHRTCSDRLLAGRPPQKGPSPSPEPADPTRKQRGGRSPGPAHGWLQKRATAWQAMPSWRPVRPQPLVGGGLHPTCSGATTQTRGRWRPGIGFDVGLEPFSGAPPPPPCPHCHLPAALAQQAAHLLEQQAGCRPPSSAGPRGGNWEADVPRL